MNPDVELGRAEQAQLVQTYHSEGYRIMHRIMRAEVDKFIVAMVNANPADREEVLARHQMAKAAAQFFEGVTRKINEEVTQYTAAPTPGDKPIDVTEGILDLGYLGEQLDMLPNILGGE